MNKAILMGRLTRDPELRTTQNNISVCSFTLAINRRFKNADGEYDTDFIPIVAWRQTAEFAARYFNKGSRMALVGSIQPRSWEDDKGERRYITEVIADEVYFVDTKKESESYTSGTSYTPKTGTESNQQGSTDSGPDIPKGQGFMPEVDDTSLPFDL